MANVGAVLKEEIVRLSRRELRIELEPFKKFRAEQRQSVALLKREIADLRREVATLRKGSVLKVPKQAAQPERKLRFVAKGLKTHRARLDLSAADYGLLLGVTHQTVRNWEEGNTHPSQADLEIIDGLRRTSKKAAQIALDQLKGPAKKKAAKKKSG